VAAGEPWDDVVAVSVADGWSGLEALSGIPGLTGAPPMQNVGAYGQEVANTITQVRALDLQALEASTFTTLTHQQCGFAYRRSIFNTTHRNRYIVTQVTFRFDRTTTPNLTYADLQRHFAGRDPAPKPIDIYHAVREIRHSKGMLIVEGEADARSAGSFFKNPVVPAATIGQIAKSLAIDPGTIPYWPAGRGEIKLAAAWLLDCAGFHKGFVMGRAGISSRHTLALVNLGGATAAELIALRDAVVTAVQDKFAVHLEQEPVMLGFPSKH